MSPRCALLCRAVPWSTVLCCAVQAFCFIVAKKRKLLFHLVSFEEEAARDQGCPPVCVCVCVYNTACVRARRLYVCWTERERERRASERERCEGKTDRTRGAGDSRFWTRFGDRSRSTAKAAHGKISRKKTYFASPLPSIQRVRVLLILFRGSFFLFGVSQSAGQVFPLKDAPRDFDADVSLTSCCWTWTHLRPNGGKRRARSCCPPFLLSLAEWTHF